MNRDDADREYERSTREREHRTLLERTVAALRAEEERMGDGGCAILAKHLDAAREFLSGTDEEFIRDIVGRFEYACGVAREASGLRPQTLQELVTSINNLMGKRK